MRVLFVSKPIVPPFHDGTKCLVRDVATHLRSATPVVMTTRGAPPLEGVEMQIVYSAGGGFTPALAANARAAAWLLGKSRADLWHFVFAPNPPSSRVGRWAKTLRRKPVVQTIASAPRSFDDIGRLLFGDIVVAQSTWTRGQVLSAVGDPERFDVRVIPPPVAAIEPRSSDARAAARQALAIDPDAPVFIYPGDLETSSGAEAVAALVEPLVGAVPGAVVVFACRAKTREAPVIAERLAARLDARHVRFAGEISDLLALVAEARAVLFPVDDLWGKVDLPIALLESMSLGVPVITLDHGPLSDLESAVRVPLGDSAALLEAAVAMAHPGDARSRVIDEQRAQVRRQFSAEAVAAEYEALYEVLASGERR